MANKLEVPVTTVQGWKKRGAIPAARLADLRAAAQRHGIPLDEADLEAVSGSEPASAPAPVVPVAPGPVTASAPPSPPKPELKSEPEPVVLSDAAPVPVNVPLAVPPVLPEVVVTVPPFEMPAPEVPTAEIPVSALPVSEKPAVPEKPAPGKSAPPPVRTMTRPEAQARPVSTALPTSRPSSLSAALSSVTSSSPSTSAPVPAAAVAAAAARLAAAATPVASAAGGRLMALGPARLSLAAALVALVAAGIAVWSSPPPPPQTAGAAPVTERRLGDLETKVTRVALERDSQTAAIGKQITALDSKLAQTASRKATDELAERLAVLEKDMPALQQRLAAQGLGSPTVAVLLAATQLRGVLNTANSYVNELAAFRLTGYTDPPLKLSLDQISSRATSGIATEAWLIGRFSTVQGNILRAATLGNPGARVADLMLDVLSDLAPPLYRLTGVPEGTSPRAIADRTQALMAAGDFTHAVEQMGELTGLPAEVAAPWLAEARARVIADRARAQLAKHMLANAHPGAK